MSRKQALEAKIDQIKAALFDSLISDFQQKAPLLDADKAVFDNTLLQDFSEDGKNLFTCTLLLMTLSLHSLYPTSESILLILFVNVVEV